MLQNDFCEYKKPRVDSELGEQTLVKVVKGHMVTDGEGEKHNCDVS